MIEAVVFDMAGTTVDEQNVVYKTLRKAIRTADIEVSLEEVLRIGAGKEKRQAIADVLEEHAPEPMSGPHIDGIHSHFLDLLDQAYESLDVQVFEGVLQAFRWLFEAGIKVVLNTGYSREIAESLLYRLPTEVQDHVDLLVTASDVNNSRPAPDMIQLAMSSLGIRHPESVVKIGDSIVDIQEGKTADCGLTFGITTGAHTRAQLETANPDFVIDRMNEMIDIIRMEALVSD